MKHASWQDSDHHRVEALLAGVPFFNEVARDDADQRARLLARTEIIEAGPGDIVIRAGEVESSLYFLLRGQLVVLGDEEAPAAVLYYVSPGRCSAPCPCCWGGPRRHHPGGGRGPGSSVGAAGFQRFRRRSRHALHPGHAAGVLPHAGASDPLGGGGAAHAEPGRGLAAGLRKVPVFTGERDSEAELASLREQARALADLLYRWNHLPPGTTGNAQLT